MNRYRYQFVCGCPNNGEAIVYTLAIHAEKMIQVERIKEVCNRFGSAFHEDIADALHEEFGGFQVLVANHHGVNVETDRGAVKHEPQQHNDAFSEEYRKWLSSETFPL